MSPNAYVVSRSILGLTTLNPEPGMRNAELRTRNAEKKQAATMKAAA